MAAEHLLWMVGGSPNVRAYFDPRLKGNGITLLGHWEGQKDYERPPFPVGATAILLLQDGSSAFQRSVVKQEASSRRVKVIHGMRSWEITAAVIADAIKQRVEVEPTGGSAEADRILGPAPAAPTSAPAAQTPTPAALTAGPSPTPAAIARLIAQVGAHEPPPPPPPRPVVCPAVDGQGHGRHPRLPARGCPYCAGSGSVPDGFARPAPGDGEEHCLACGAALVPPESERCLYCSTYVPAAVLPATVASAAPSTAAGQPPAQSSSPPQSAAPAPSSRETGGGDAADSAARSSPSSAVPSKPEKPMKTDAAVPSRAERYAEAILRASDGKLTDTFVSKQVGAKVGYFGRLQMKRLRERIGSAIDKPEHTRGVSAAKDSERLWAEMKKEGKVPEVPQAMNGVEDNAPTKPAKAAKAPRAPRAEAAPRTPRAAKAPAVAYTLQPLTKFQEGKITKTIEASGLQNADRLARHVLDTFDMMLMDGVKRLVLGLSADGGSPTFEWAFIPPPPAEKTESVDL